MTYNSTNVQNNRWDSPIFLAINRINDLQSIYKDNPSVHLHATCIFQSAKDHLRFCFFWREASSSPILSCMDYIPIVKEKCPKTALPLTKVAYEKIKKLFSLTSLFSSTNNFFFFMGIIGVGERRFTYQTICTFYDSNGASFSAPKNDMISSLSNGPPHSWYPHFQILHIGPGGTVPIERWCTTNMQFHPLECYEIETPSWIQTKRL